MADFPIALTADLTSRLARCLDIEGKIPRAFEALGPIAGADVLLVDGQEGPTGIRARQLAALGGRLAVVSGDTPGGEGADGADPLAGSGEATADVLVSCWSWFRSDMPANLRSAERVLRDGGRILALHDYGRDDVARLRPSDLPEYTTWGRRDGWFLKTGFKVRVIHCWWTFDTVEDTASFLGEAFGVVGETVGAALKRSRLSYNVAIYHRTKGETAG